ncbi:MAG: serine aminopeptidase domain-containing protein [Planctomycetota bacterium]
MLTVPVVEAFFFGPSDQSVLGMYHPPAGVSGGGLTVMCPPLLSEHERTHFALRRLAISLAAQGQHVLRFDYRGTGDSFGDLHELSLSDWVADIAAGVREARELSRARTTQLLAVRAGALLACHAMERLEGIHRVVAWDPIFDGRQYLEGRRAARKRAADYNYLLSRSERREAAEDYDGFRLSEGMVSELGRLGLEAYRSIPRSRLRIITSDPAAHFPLDDVPRDVVPFPCRWNTNRGDRLVPAPILERLAACLTAP